MPQSRIDSGGRTIEVPVTSMTNCRMISAPASCRRWKNKQWIVRSGSRAAVARRGERVSLAPESRPTASSIFPGFSAGFLSVDKSVVRPIAHSCRGRWCLSTWHAVRTGVGAGRRSRHSAPIPREPPRMRGSVCRSAFQPYRDFATSPPRDRLGSFAGPREPSAFAGDARSLGRVTDHGPTGACAHLGVARPASAVL